MKYPLLASALAQGSLVPAQASDASPMYLLANVLVSHFSMRVLQGLLAAASVAVVFDYLAQICGRWSAWFGSILLAFSQSWLVYSAVLEPDLLLAFLLLIAARSLSIEQRSARWVAMIALGAAISVRPTAAAYAGLVGAWWVWRGVRIGELVAPVGVACVVALVPSLVLRHLASQDLRGTMSAGQVFHQSHRPESMPYAGSFPTLIKLVETQASSGSHAPDYAHTIYRTVAQIDHPDLSDSSSELVWFSRGFAFIFDQPLVTLQRQLHKALFFVVLPSFDADIPVVQSMLSTTVGVPLQWLLVFGCGSMCVWLCQLLQSRSSVLPWGPWAMHWLAALLVSQIFYFQGRYATELVPVVCILIAFAMRSMLDTRIVSLQNLCRLTCFALPVALCWLEPVRWASRLAERVEASAHASERTPPTEDRWKREYAIYIRRQAAMPDVFWPGAPFGAGLRADDRAMYVEAATRAEQDWGTAGSVDATLAAGLWLAAGRCDLALPLASRAAMEGFYGANCDALIEPRLIVSDCLLSLGERSQAVSALEAAEREAPGRLEVLVRLVAAGDTGSATSIERWEQELRRYHDPASVHYALSRARRLWGDAQGAVEDARWVASHWVQAAPFAAFEEASALASMGRWKEAQPAWILASSLTIPMHGLSALDGVAAAAVLRGGGTELQAALRHFRLRGDRQSIQKLRANHPWLIQNIE